MSQRITIRPYLGNIDTTYTAKDRQRDTEEGDFMWIPRYHCSTCGSHFVREPETVCVARETWGYWGGEPAEYDWRCPECDSLDCVSENDSPRHPTCKIIRRYSIHRNPSYREAAR